ncbi:MAG: phosphoribosylamine--glycine ligase [Calditrichae bacterium]|nr:phosphoribosylamine--glycine ligase [Calditrichia bacterium]
MNILVLGSGGREHALAWKIKQSPLLDKLYCIPGNPGTKDLAENVNIDLNDFETIIRFVKNNNIELTIVGPEDPLVNGIVDEFNKNGLAIFGPSKAAARLEGSKRFSKDLMQQHNIPTASYATFDNIDDATAYISKLPSYPVVLKADGLAAGKGVLICSNQDEAFSAINEIMADKKFGKAGETLVVEQFIKGDEASIFAICDGENYCILPASQDHKKVGEADSGKNTGGMGAYAPAPLVDAGILAIVEDRVLKPTLKAMIDQGAAYRGLLYIGLIISEGEVHVLEYNCRFGDPETQAVLPLVKSDLVPFFMAAAGGSLKGMHLEIYDKCAMDVVLTSGGYPDSYAKSKPINGLDKVENNVIVFHAGTVYKENILVTSGGRVLNVVAVEKNFKECAKEVYTAINKINFEKMYFRKDIGFKVLK